MMRNENVKFCLMIVTSDGWYRALPDAPAQKSVKEIRELEDVYQRMVPGHFRNYYTFIMKCDENFDLSEHDINILKRQSEDIRRRLSRSNLL